MKTITLAEDTWENLEVVPGKNVQDKISHLLESHVLSQLKDCEERLFRFESKYGMDFENFLAQWKTGEIPVKHSHEVERDYMEWEGFNLERMKLFQALRKIKLKRRS